ncbi:hypothetical protein RND71_032223 [Anisodus tanguticus]|uniref:BED-type domain-containing protein n=1 Tax=Anisodus tanguticus TaxID=243964 RepID=A0AAE1RDB0_9SOLA|nr:hypothetical protein RND71_032223 [Anisodus tanguticus]
MEDILEDGAEVVKRTDEGKLRSKVWNFFTKLPGGKKVKCHFCRKDYACDSSLVGTTNLRNHLGRCKVEIKS